MRKKEFSGEKELYCEKNEDTTSFPVGQLVSSADRLAAAPMDVIGIALAVPLQRVWSVLVDDAWVRRCFGGSGELASRASPTSSFLRKQDGSGQKEVVIYEVLSSRRGSSGSEWRRSQHGNRQGSSSNGNGGVNGGGTDAADDAVSASPPSPTRELLEQQSSAGWAAFAAEPEQEARQLTHTVTLRHLTHGSVGGRQLSGGSTGVFLEWRTTARVPVMGAAAAEASAQLNLARRGTAVRELLQTFGGSGSISGGGSNSGSGSGGGSRESSGGAGGIGASVDPHALLRAMDITERNRLLTALLNTMTTDLAAVERRLGIKPPAADTDDAGSDAAPVQTSAPQSPPVPKGAKSHRSATGFYA